MWSLFGRDKRKASGEAVRAPSSFRPGLEALEDRLCPSGGLLDPTFGSGGTENLTLPSTLSNSQRAMAIQPDGKIVSVGQLILTNKAHEISVVRMNPNGSLDTSFNGSGYVALKAGSSALTTAGAVALQPDGKILVGGWATTSSASFDFNHEEFVVARLNPNGTLDKTFARSGMFIWYPTSGDNNVRSLAVLSDGSIVASGVSPAASGQDAAVFKLSASGALVSSFGNGGLATFQPVSGTSIQSMAVAPNGDLILGGNDSLNGAGILIAVNQSTGRLDTTFNNGLGWIANFNPAGDGPTAFTAVAIQGNNIIAAGNTNISGSAGGLGLLARFSLTGALDTTFANGGTYVTATHNPFDNVAVEPDGSIVVSGGGGQMTAGHFTAAGQADTTFGGAGTGFAVISGSGEGYGLALAADGSIIVCGNGPVSGETLYTRLTPPEAMIGSFTANPNPVASGSNGTLTASNIAADGGTITQVAFYLDSNNDGTLEPGTDTLLGDAVQTTPGVWTLTFSTSAFGLTKGTYTLLAQAEDSSGVFGDPIALTLTVQ